MLCNYSLNYFILLIDIQYFYHLTATIFATSPPLERPYLLRLGTWFLQWVEKNFAPLVPLLSPLFTSYSHQIDAAHLWISKEEKIFTIKTAKDENILEDVFHLSFMPSSSARGLRIICRTWVGSRRVSIKKVGLDSLQEHLNQTKNFPTAYTPLPSTAACLSALSAVPY